MLIDKFGYTKSVDEGTYVKAAPEVLQEFVHTVRMKNSDVLCVFTAEGNMYRVKAEKLPKCRIKEKGVLIHNLCKLDQEEAIFYCSFEELFESQLVFTTEAGFIKQVSGIEFDTGRLCVAATKLETNDRIAGISMLSAADVLAGNRKAVIVTKNGYGLAFPLAEVPEMKKTGRGVKGITMDKSDKVIFAGVAGPETTEFAMPNGKKLDVKKLKTKPRASKGVKGVV